MSRTSKIARLPFAVRDELNGRIRNGEPGTHLVAWLNGHPEVQPVLEKHFAGREITEQNLSDWRAGGYEEALALEELRGEAIHLAEDAGVLVAEVRSLPENLATVLSIRFAALLAKWDGEPTEEFERKLRVMDRLRQSVVALQRGHLKHWEIDLKSRQYWDGVKREELKRRAKKWKNEALKEMMIRSTEKWNKEHPDDQKHYSFLKPDDEKSEKQAVKRQKAVRDKRGGAKNAKVFETGGGKARKRKKCEPHGRSKGGRMKRGNIQQPTSNAQHPVTGGGVEKEKKPRTLNVEPSNLERKGGQNIERPAADERGGAENAKLLKAADQNIQRSKLDAQHPEGVEEMKSLRVEEAGKEEPATLSVESTDLESTPVEEKKKVRVDAIVWPRRVSKWHRGLEG